MKEQLRIFNDPILRHTPKIKPHLYPISIPAKGSYFITIIMIALFLGTIFYGCSKRDVIRLTKIATTGDVASAQEMAVGKALNYAVNPKALDRDIRAFQKNFAIQIKKFRKAVGHLWGTKDAREPKPKEYVKYTQNYLCRTVVDFDRGIITVETIEPRNPLQSLKTAIITTLLTPDDPRAVDLYSAQSVKLGDTPFLYGEVTDADGQPIRWVWRAERFADHLIEKRLQSRTIDHGQKVASVLFVTISMLADHHNIRAQKYRPLVKKFGGQYHLSQNLLYAIMKTESDFNPYAVSQAPAFGLMQIVPATAGKDVNIFLNKHGVPSDQFLFVPENNIQYGSVYLFLLSDKYLKEIAHPVSRQYCVIAGYNTGAGNVLRTFDSDPHRAAKRINSISPLEVYRILRTQLPYGETRRYITKVIDAQKSFVNF